jgi:hypothetical protein
VSQYPYKKLSLFILAAFFLSINITNAKELKTNRDFWSEWGALLYLIDDEFKIKSPNFLLSYESPSLKKELTLYIQYLRKNNTVCKYPARYNLLLKYNLITKVQKKCPELTEYEKKAPINSFKYIYASESLTSITGMLGHGFLMGEYKNKGEEIIQHSFSFFTDLRQANQITLAFDAFAFGMEGIFALKPYQQDLNRYLKTENRNVWELELDLTDHEVASLRNILWELRDVYPKYLFQSFNCATLTLYAISIIKPEILNYQIMFVTPLDIYQALTSLNLVRTTKVWSPTPEKVVNPAFRIQDSLFGINYSRNGASLTFTPASHYFRTIKQTNDKNSELLISALELDINKFKIKKLNLYELTNLNTNKTFSSKSVSIYMDNTNFDKNWFLSYNVGTSVKYKDNVFSVLPGIGFNATTSNPYLSLKLYYSINFTHEIKVSAFSEKKWFNSKTSIFEYNVTLSKRLNNYIFYLGFNKDEKIIVNVGLDYHF